MDAKGHYQKALQNEVVYGALCGMATRAQDWEIVLIFYSAVHYVDAMIKKSRPVSIADHNQRKSFLRKLQPALYPDYIALESLSRDARYNSLTMALPASDVKSILDFVQNKLKPLAR